MLDMSLDDMIRSNGGGGKGRGRGRGILRGRGQARAAATTSRSAINKAPTKVAPGGRGGRGGAVSGRGAGKGRGGKGRVAAAGKVVVVGKKGATSAGSAVPVSTGECLISVSPSQNISSRGRKDYALAAPEPPATRFGAG